MSQRRGNRSGRGRGQGSYNRPYQDSQPRGQRNQSRCNSQNFYQNGYLSPQSASVSGSFTELEHEDVPVSPQHEPLASASSKKMVKTRTVHPEELGIELKVNSTTTPLLPRRPKKPGNLGKRIRLVSNCFPIEIPSGYVYHYDVKIITKDVIHTESEIELMSNDHSHSESGTNATSDSHGNSEFEASGTADEHKKYKCLSTRTNRKIISRMIDTLEIFNGQYPAFDGKNNLYIKEELQADFPLKFEITLTSDNLVYAHDHQELREDVYEVEIKPVKKYNTQSCAINLDTIHAFFERRTDSVPEEAIMAVETILRHSPCLRFTPIGHSFYYPPNPSCVKPIGGGVEIWLGYHQSIRLGQWKPTVNLDTACATFLSEGPVLNYIADSVDKSIEGLQRIPFIDEKDIAKISHQLANKEVRITHLNFRQRIIKLTNLNANETHINIDGRKLSVADYFKRKHRIALKYPNLPLLQVKPERKNIFLPLEVCEFTPGQHYKSELTQRQKSNMIKFTSIPPVQRFKKIDDIVRSADFNVDKCNREFNLRVCREPLSLEGRVLISPTLVYAGEERIRPRNGSWFMQSTQFLKGSKISRWMLISFRNHENLEEFASLLVETGEEMGIDINPSFTRKTVNIKCDIESLLFEAIEQDLVVIVIPKVKEKEQTRIYADIKKAAEICIGLKTQCIKEERLEDMYERRGRQIVRNLCLKINAKMGGENYSLVSGEIPKILWKPVIIIGADVSHPPPIETTKSKIQPSIAACVGSLDSYCKRFSATVRLQPKTKKETSRTEEIICSLESMVVDLLKAFYRHTNGLKPEKIIFYRDGVSEGEFAAVKSREVVSVRKACQSLQKDYEPGITFIVVQKRHHVRFKPTDSRDAFKGNAPAGTVADTVVTHPLNHDFYLFGHPGMLGTSRPSHYTVIEDDNDFSANDLQKMTYQFCHMYVRCTKSISIPAPVAYAHLVAYRARKHLSGKSVSTSNGSSSINRSTLEDIYKEIKVVDDLKDSMYFV